MYARCLKRMIDCFLSFLAIVALSPLLLILTIAGSIAMHGNPFFVQKRPGKKNKKTGKEKVFNLIKFRTMNNACDMNGNLLPDSERLNWYGRLLRKTSFDEWPEILNIFVGDMAIIGPRPLLVCYLPRYSEEQRHRHDVRPGLTGYAQVHGRNTVSWDEKFVMDVWYTKHISFFGDVKIFFETILAVIKRSGISSGSSETMEEFMGEKGNNQ